MDRSGLVPARRRIEPPVSLRRAGIVLISHAAACLVSTATPRAYRSASTLIGLKSSSAGHCGSAATPHAACHGPRRRHAIFRRRRITTHQTFVASGTKRSATMQAGIPARRWGYVIPMAVVMYVLAYVDRINVAMVLPYVDKTFGLSAADSGFAAGIFFVGYMVLQIPGGLLASRWSARKTVALLMVLWGVTAVASGFVQSREQLYA